MNVGLSQKSWYHVTIILFLYFFSSKLPCKGTTRPGRPILYQAMLRASHGLDCITPTSDPRQKQYHFIYLFIFFGKASLYLNEHRPSPGGFNFQ